MILHVTKTSNSWASADTKGSYEGVLSLQQMGHFKKNFILFVGFATYE
jgi:hypothetical protein